MAATSGFHVADYVLFAGTLAISLAVGIYYSCVGGKQKTTSEYLMGDRGFRPLPVAMSMLMSYISAILILGNTAEMYTAGIQFWLACIGSSLAFAFSAVVFVPFFYNLKLTSSFEYLEVRFNAKIIKIWATVMFILSSIVYMGLAIFSPATALEAATGFPVWGSIIAAGAVATIYTAMGGMKAVIWTDTIQGAILIIGVVTVLIIGSVKVGGLGEVWRLSGEGGRLKLFDFNPDPTVRLSFWSVIFGRFFISLNYIGTGQTSVQRFSAVRTLKAAKLTALLNIPAVIIIYTLTCLMGLVVYAYYAKTQCDPIRNGDITSSNQLLPYFIMDVINYPGIPGLFLAVLFSGALSSISSSLNSMAACTWKDLLEGWFMHISEPSKALINKILVILYGIIAIGMAFASEYIGGHVLQASQSLVGGIGGPSLGMFILAAFFPWANWQGALFGSLIGFGLSTWQSIGSYVSGVSTRGMLNTTTAGCERPNTTSFTPLPSTSMYTADYTTMAAIPDTSSPLALYQLSYMWTAAFGCLTTLIAALLISLITGPTSPSTLEPRLVIPVFDRLCCCLPARWLRKCWCGVLYDEQDDTDIPADETEDKDDVILDAVKENGIEGGPTSEKSGRYGTFEVKAGVDNDAFQHTHL